MSRYDDAILLLPELPVLLREARDRRGLSMRIAAGEIGIGHVTLRKFETGRIDSMQWIVMAILLWLARQPPEHWHHGVIRRRNSKSFVRCITCGWETEAFYSGEMLLSSWKFHIDEHNTR